MTDDIHALLQRAAEAMGGASTVLATTLPSCNERRSECSYGYRGAEFCIAYPFVDHEQKTRFDFVSFGHADARFIAAARTLVPDMAAAITALRARLAETEAALATVRADALREVAAVCDRHIAETDNGNAKFELQAAKGAILALIPATPAPREVSVQEAARVLLDAYDRFMEGADDVDGLARRVSLASSFASEAYRHANGDDHGPHALARSFLSALIDPARPDLDYLRADPASGAAMRHQLNLRALAEPKP